MAARLLALVVNTVQAEAAERVLLVLMVLQVAVEMVAQDRPGHLLLRHTVLAAYLLVGVQEALFSLHHQAPAALVAVEIVQQIVTGRTERLILVVAAAVQIR
jgi:hypothetical protein